MLLEMRTVFLGWTYLRRIRRLKVGLKGSWRMKDSQSRSINRIEDIPNQNGASGFRKTNGWERKRERGSGEADVESEERIGVWVPFGTSPFVAAAGAVASTSFGTFNNLVSSNQAFILPSIKSRYFSLFAALTTWQQIWIQSLNRRPNRYSDRPRDESSCDAVQITNRKTMT